MRTTKPEEDKTIELNTDKQMVAQCAECACFNLRKATRAVTQLYDDTLRSIGLRATQFTVLVHTRVYGPVTVTRLAEMMVMDRTTLTRNLEPLQKRGLIEVTSGEDRRTRVVTLTDQGNKVLAKALPLWKQTQARIVEGLGQERWSSTLTNLSEMVSLTQQT